MDGSAKVSVALVQNPARVIEAFREAHDCAGLRIDDAEASADVAGEHHLLVRIVDDLGATCGEFLLLLGH